MLPTRTERPKASDPGCSCGASGSGIRRYDYVIVAKWLAQETYRHLLHRHDGTLRACDEAFHEAVDADNIRSLATKLLNWKTEARKY